DKCFAAALMAAPVSCPPAGPLVTNGSDGLRRSLRPGGAQELDQLVCHQVQRRGGAMMRQPPAVAHQSSSSCSLASSTSTPLSLEHTGRHHASPPVPPTPPLWPPTLFFISGPVIMTESDPITNALPFWARHRKVKPA